MIDCGDTNSCLIPMSMQYIILAVAFIMFSAYCWGLAHKDPYDRM